MKDTIKNYLSCPIFVSSFIFLSSVGALGAALVAEHFFGLKPCPLCIYQRIPFAVAAILSMLGLVFSYSPDRMKIPATLTFVCGLLFLAGSVIAAYHSGVERHWWTSILEGCTVDFSNSNDLLAMIENTKAARCDEIPWADPIMGLSMANYNIAFSAFLAIISMGSAVFITRRANGF